MATAIAFPILAALEPVIAPLVVKLLDKVLGNKTGPVKLSTGVSWFKNLFSGILKSGQASDKQIPDDTVLQSWLQQIVDRLNKDGELKGQDTVIPLPGVGSAGSAGSPVPPASGHVTISTANAELILRLLVSISPSLGVKL